MVDITADWFEAEHEYTDEVIEQDTIPLMVETSAGAHASRDAQWYKGGVYDRSLVPAVVPAALDGEYAALTYDDLIDVVQNLAAGFRELGVESGDRVGIFAETRMEWAHVDFGLLAAGAVVTTVYTDSPPSRVQHLLSDSGASGVVVGTADLLDRVLAVEDDLDLSFVVVMDEVEGHADREDVLTLGGVHERGRAAFEPGDYERWLATPASDDLASLVYTSGTTGEPKGVELTHGNFLANLGQFRKRYGPRPDKPPDLPTLDADARALSVLPLAHVFERTVGHFVHFASGATVAYAESPTTVAEDMYEVGPTVLTAVPRVYERIYERMREQAGESPVGTRIFERAVAAGREHATADDPGRLSGLRHALADWLEFSTLRTHMGGNVEFLFSGGGTLDRKLAELYEGMGVPIFEGYGLTETGPVVSTNPVEDPRAGTLGPPVVDLDVRLDPSVVPDEDATGPRGGGAVGELLVRGPNVFESYWNRPDATDAAFAEEGWFRTGDIVELDDDGYLVYHDRLKELLVLDTGENVSPRAIESAFATVERVSQVMVVGDDRPFVGALIVPDVAAVRRWADREDIELPDDTAAVCQDERVNWWIGEAVAEVNSELASHEAIKEFRLVPGEWTTDNDLLTPSMKKKRRAIRRRFAERVEDIYTDDGDDG